MAKSFKNMLFGGGSSAETPFVSPEDYPTFDIFKPNEPKGNGGKGGTGGTGGTGGSGRSGGNTLKTQEQQQKEMLALQRAYEDASLELLTDADNKEYMQMRYKYDRQIQDLQATLEKKKAANQLSAKDEQLYNNQITQLAEVRDKKLLELTDKFDAKDKQEREKKQREEEQAQQQSKRMQERAIQLQYEYEMEVAEQIETSEKEKTRM